MKEHNLRGEKTMIDIAFQESRNQKGILQARNARNETSRRTYGYI